MDELTQGASTNEVEEGDFTTRKVQSQGRVDIPNDYLQAQGLEEGDDVIIRFTDDGIEVIEKSSDALNI